ncbi:MAG: PLP-dependent aminotransferase family protein [Sulfolobales archaeon]|nr:PLP-dependent aminotransferase family protein [Sulfolobales archaeon]MDW8083088.1 PLP-dependent aminotransferase family protein [Sulfolobales archaeon]
MDYSKFIARASEVFKASEIRELLKVVEARKVISFAGGYPDPQVFPRESLARIASDVILNYGDKALQYSPTKGVTVFRQTLLKYLKDNNVRISSNDDVIVTTGSQQSLDIVSRTLVDPGDYIITENPTYLAALTAFRTARPNIIGIPIDERGMKTDVLEEKLRNLKSSGIRVKFVYTIPVAHNPAGATMSSERKKHLLELASRYDFIVIEDDPYSFFVYDEADVTRLKTLDSEDRVVYISTMSKTLSPGLRVGWILGPQQLVDVFERAKQSMDLHTPTLSQYIAKEAIEKGVVSETAEKARRIYRVKRDVMFNTLSESMVEKSWWVKPVGGLFLMVWLPPEIDTKEMLPTAINEGVVYVPGASFFVDESGRNTMRLNFSYPSIEEIRSGIEILGKVVRRKLGR